MDMVSRPIIEAMVRITITKACRSDSSSMMISSEGVWRAVEFLEMQENAAKSILVAKILGNAKTLPTKDVDELVRTVEKLMK